MPTADLGAFRRAVQLRDRCRAATVAAGARAGVPMSGAQANVAFDAMVNLIRDHDQDAWGVRPQPPTDPPVWLQDRAVDVRYGDTAPSTSPGPCCPFHDRGDEPCSPTGWGGYCCARCPDVIGTAPNPSGGED